MDREINKETRVIDRSTMKRSEYITWHLFYIIVALVLANRLLFVTLPRLSAIQSRLILVFAIILISLVFSIPRWKRNRTQIAVIEDVIIGLGMYIITAYWRFYKNWFTIIIIILSFTTFIVSVCVWLPKYKGQHIFNIENRCTKKRVFKSRFLRMSNLTSLIITVCMLILSGPIIYNKLFYGGIKASTINNDYVVDRGDNSRHVIFVLQYLESREENTEVKEIYFSQDENIAFWECGLFLKAGKKNGTTIVGVKACIDGVMRTDHIMVTVNNGKFVSIMFEKH